MRTHCLLAAALLLTNTVDAVSQTEHDREVAAVVNTQLISAFAMSGQMDVATRIQAALAKVTALRDQPGRSTDDILRDAEYYLHGLYGASAKDWEHVGPTLLAPFYDALKWAAIRCKDAGRPELEAWLRTKRENPVSEPGGAIWAYRGLVDGWPIDGSQVVGARTPGHGLDLRALDSASACVPSQDSVGRSPL